MKCGSGCSRRDLVTGRWAIVLWCIPTALIIAGMLLPGARAWLWIPSFSIMGIACIVNARGCGRLHCFITGPLFLLGALASVLDAFAVVTVDWRLIVAAVGAGTIAGYALEWIRGKYAGTSVP